MSSTMRNIVRQEMDRRSETKMITTQGTEVAISTLTPTAVHSVTYPSQSDGAAGRDGNRIRPTGLKVSSVFHKTGGETLWVRQLVLCLKEGASMTDANLASALFESTAGGTTGDIPASGTIQDVIRKVNRERVVCLKDDVYKLSSEDSGKTAEWSKNYFKFPSYKMLEFTNDASTQPSRDRIAIVILPMQADGDEGVGQTLEYTYRYDFYYKDL